MPNLSRTDIAGTAVETGLSLLLGASPQGAAIVAISSIFSKLLISQQPESVSETTLRREFEITARRIYGRRKIDGFVIYAQSRLLSQSQFVPLGSSTNLTGQSDGRTSIADILLYLSDGELNSLRGIFVDGEYHELRTVDGYRVPANDVNSHYGKLQIKELFATSNRAGEILVPYTPDDTRSYILLSLLSQDDGIYRNGVPSLQFLTQGVKVRDLSNFSDATAPLVYTDNAASIYYDIVTNFSDGAITDFDTYTLLNAFNYCGEKLVNNLDLYDGDNQALSHGQVFYHSDYHLARESKRGAANMIVESGENIDQVLLALETIMEGGSYIRGSKIHLYTGNSAKWVNPVVLDEQDLDFGTFQITSQPRADRLYNAIESEISQSQAHIYERFSLNTKNLDNINRDGSERPIKTGEVRGVTDPFQLSRMHNHALISQNFNVVARGTFSGEKYVKLKPRQNVLINIPSRELYDQKAIVVQASIDFLSVSVVVKLSDPKEWLDYYEIPPQEDFIETPIKPDPPSDVDIETNRDFINETEFLSALITLTAPSDTEWIEIRLRRAVNAPETWDQVFRQVVTFATDGVQRITLGNLVDDTNYVVELYSLSRSGTFSDVYSFDYNPGHDTTPPDDPEDVVSTAIPGGAYVTWTEVRVR